MDWIIQINKKSKQIKINRIILKAIVVFSKKLNQHLLVLKILSSPNVVKKESKSKVSLKKIKIKI